MTTEPRAKRKAVEVFVDRQSSARHTVLEIVADDSLGLLYRISRVISDHYCDIDLVLVSTEGQKAIDVFYLTERGSKLGEEKQEALRDALQKSLA